MLISWNLSCYFGEIPNVYGFYSRRVKGGRILYKEGERFFPGGWGVRLTGGDSLFVEVALEEVI